jgi:hypothetical protein
MKFSKHERIIILFLCFLIIVLVGIWKAEFLYIKGNEQDGVRYLASLAHAGAKEKRDGINKYINEAGAEETYDMLKKAYADNYTPGHDIAHIFGEELYRIKGEKGINICDFQLGFGCFHGFSIKALSGEGVSVLAKIEKICLSEYPTTSGACTHGLGHGALEYFGHNNLVKALEACLTLSWKGKIHGCGDGVFMEYNSPREAASQDVTQTVRKMTEGKPYDVCPDLPEKHRRTCYYSLGQWWGVLMRHDFEKMGNLCLKVKDEYERKTCFLGIGNIVPISLNFKYKNGMRDNAELCEKMPSLEGEHMCKTAVYGLIARGEHYTPDAADVCRGLPAELENSCLDGTAIQDIESGPFVN